MEFSELLTTRRSVRKYLDKPVEIDLVKELIAESTLAPSAGNEQSWKFIVVQNKDLLARISADCKKNLLDRIARNPGDYVKKYETMLSNPSLNIFYNAPCLVLVLGESRGKNLELDCTLAASYFMFSAAARGLGTCWINFAKALADPALLDAIGMPADHTVVAPIIVGYPAHLPAVPPRREAEILKIVT